MWCNAVPSDVQWRHSSVTNMAGKVVSRSTLQSLRTDILFTTVCVYITYTPSDSVSVFGARWHTDSSHPNWEKRHLTSLLVVADWGSDENAAHVLGAQFAWLPIRFSFGALLNLLLPSLSLFLSGSWVKVTVDGSHHLARVIALYQSGAHLSSLSYLGLCTVSNGGHKCYCLFCSKCYTARAFSKKRVILWTSYWPDKNKTARLVHKHLI